MNLFRHWTKQHKIIGGLLAVFTAVNLLANGFFSDYELAKEEALLEGQEELVNFEENQYTEFLAQQNALDEELRTSSEDTLLTKEIKHRDEYVALQQAFTDVTTGKNSSKIGTENSEMIQNDGVQDVYFTAIYTEEEGLRSGYVQYIGSEVTFYRYAYDGERVTELSKVGQYDMQEVQIIEE